MFDFVEPASSPLLISLAQTAWPAFAQARLGHLHIEVCQDVFEAFHQLKERRAIICPNHPSREDALVLFGLSGIIGERFSYLTAREVFGQSGSLRLNWLQKLGCYSVERGTVDIKAFRVTRAMLVETANKIVICPEGEVSYQNAVLTDLENGPELMALSALRELKKRGSSESIYVLPLALKYRYSKDVRTQVQDVLQEVERNLEIDGSSVQSLKQRIKHAYEVMLAVLEEAHEGEIHSNLSLDERLHAIRERFIAEVQGFVHADLPTNLSQTCRIHLLKNVFNETQFAKRSQETSQSASSAELAHFYYNLLRRALRLTAIGDHSFEQALTQEEAAELVAILVQEVCRNLLTVQKPDIALFGAAEVIDVEQFLQPYESDKKEGVRQLKSELTRRMTGRLRELEHCCEPYVVC